MEGGLRHNAFVYESTEHYAERALPFVTDGLDAGEAVIVAATRDHVAVVREALGSGAERASLIDARSLYTRPARTVAACYGALLEMLRTARAARLLADVQFGPAPGEWGDWAIYEAVLNRAFRPLPAWLLCTYDAARTPDAVLEHAWQTHPEVLRDEWLPSPRYEDPARLVRSLTAAPEALDDLREQAPGHDVEALRERLAAELSGARVPPARALDMLVAATEVATNAWRHGGGPRELRTGRVDGHFVCEIRDGGPGFDDPLAGYLPPGPGERASGLWTVRQLTWRQELFASERGFTVRLWL